MPIPGGSLGVAGGGYSLDASAKSGATAKSGDVRNALGDATITEGSGNRAFQNFVAFSGAQQEIEASSSTGINPLSKKQPITNTLIWIALIAAVGLVAMTLLRR